MSVALVKSLSVVMPNEPVGVLLEQWGRWSCSGVGTGGLSTPTYENDHWISDDVAMCVDRAIGQLKVCDEHRKLSGVKVVCRERAVMLFYKNRYNLPMLANALKVGETKAKTVLLLAESWIEGYLELHVAVA